MIKKIVLWYLRKISLEQCATHECENCPFGTEDCVCSVTGVIQGLQKI
jgi:hypothetical protein